MEKKLAHCLALSHPTFKPSDPGSPCPPPSQANIAISHLNGFAAFYKETYEKLSRPGWLGMEGKPPTRGNSSPYKQALKRLQS